ncbi:MAG: hypothetical protein ACK4YD_09290, partial [Chitinophagia bacterium]
HQCIFLTGAERETDAEESNRNLFHKVVFGWNEMTNVSQFSSESQCWCGKFYNSVVILNVFPYLVG